MLWGCDDQNTVRPTEDVTAAASPVFLTPAFDGELIRRYSDMPTVWTKHRGSSLYSGARTAITPSGSIDPVLSLPNRDYRNDGVYFTERALNENAFNASEDGRYRITATYTTFIQNGGVGNQVQEVPGSPGFRVCFSTNFDCIAAARAENPQQTAERDEYCPEAPMPSRAQTPSSEGEASRCSGGGTGTGTGGGGGGGQQIPYHLRRVPLTRSMEPFFAMTGVGSSVSENEVRAAMNRSTPAQLDDIAAIMLEVYNEDIYDHTRSAPTDTDSPFLTLAEALTSSLDAWPATDVEGRRSFLNTLSARYVAEVALLSDDRPYVAARSVSSHSAASTHVAEATAVIRAWPNPAVQRVTVQTDAPATGAEVYDVTGRRVARLSVSQDGAGSVAVWNLSSEGGGRVAPGLYRIVTLGDARRSVSVTVL